MRPNCQLQAFNAEVTNSFVIALSPCSHSCPLTLVPSFGNDGKGCCGWCIALSFHDTSSPRTWQSSMISPNSFGPSLVILERCPPQLGPLGLIFEMGGGTQILWPHTLNYSIFWCVLVNFNLYWDFMYKTDMILFILYMWQKEINRKKIGRLSMTDKKNNVSNKSK